MKEAGLIDVFELGDRWAELCNGHDQIAPGVRGGVRLGDGIWVVLARHLQNASAPSPELEALYARAREHEHHLLVYGLPEDRLPVRMLSSPHQHDLRDEVTRLRRHLTLAQAHTLNQMLHRADAGLHSESDGERWQAFIALGDVLVDPERRVHPAAHEELKELFVPLLSGHPGRHQAALLLGLIAEAMGHGGPAKMDEITHKLHRNLGIIGGHWTAGDWPGVLDEAKPSARICLALLGARVRFGGSDVLEQLPPEAHVAVTRAMNGSEVGYHEGMELALRLAQNGG